MIAGLREKYEQEGSARGCDEDLDRADTLGVFARSISLLERANVGLSKVKTM